MDFPTLLLIALGVLAVALVPRGRAIVLVVAALVVWLAAPPLRARWFDWRSGALLAQTPGYTIMRDEDPASFEDVRRMLRADLARGASRAATEAQLDAELEKRFDQYTLAASDDAVLAYSRVLANNIEPGSPKAEQAVRAVMRSGAHKPPLPVDRMLALRELHAMPLPKSDSERPAFYKRVLELPPHDAANALRFLLSSATIRTP
jgi:hypothetical protein